MVGPAMVAAANLAICTERLVDLSRAMQREREACLTMREREEIYSLRLSVRIDRRDNTGGAAPIDQPVHGR